jgi:hypothetical protein
MTTAPVNMNVVYDREDQYMRVLAYLIPGETLFAVYDCKGAGTGFIGVSDQRILFYDQGTLIKNRSMVSIPYNQVVVVAATDEGVVFQSCQLTISTAAGKFDYQFTSPEKARWVYQFINSQILGQSNPQLRG